MVAGVEPLENRYCAKVTLKNCYFENNFSNQLGGAIFNNGKVTIDNSTFKENRTTRWGGAISNCSEGEIRIKDTLLEKNRAGDHGGAIWSCGCIYDLDTCIFKHDNLDDYSTGSIYFEYG